MKIKKAVLSLNAISIEYFTQSQQMAFGKKTSIPLISMKELSYCKTPVEECACSPFSKKSRLYC